MREREEHYYKRHMHGRHLLQPALLLMVHMGPTHGYDLMERLEKIGLGDIDPSMIYRALHALEAEEMVTSIWEEKESQGPPRRIYSITAFGEETLSYFVEKLKAYQQRVQHILEIYENYPKKEDGNQ